MPFGGLSPWSLLKSGLPISQLVSMACGVFLQFLKARVIPANVESSPVQQLSVYEAVWALNLAIYRSVKATVVRLTAKKSEVPVQHTPTEQLKKVIDETISLPACAQCSEKVKGIIGYALGIYFRSL